MYWHKNLNKQNQTDKNSLYTTHLNQARYHINQHQKQITNLSAKNQAKVFYLGAKHANAYLTRREAQVMSLLIIGKTSIEIALQLNLSARTVEFYIKNMKLKLNCQNRSTLIACVLDSDFINNINFFDMEN